VEKLVVVDIAPLSRKPSTSFDRYIKAMHAVEKEGVVSHMHADKFLKDQVRDAGIRAFLLTNFKFDSNDKVLRLQINLDEIESSMHEIWDFPFGRTTATFEKPTLFINGGKSDYLTPDMYPTVRRHFPNMTVHTIEQAGHWVHSEAPEEFLRTIAEFVKTE
jgi:esterase